MKTPLVEIKPPGIYSEISDRKYTPISLGKTGVCGFIGLTEKGPANRPVLITSLQQFRDIFGYLTYGSYLDKSIEGYFKNGGKECYVLRVAHFFERGRGEVAKKASVRVQDWRGKNTILFTATSEGIWGNNIKLCVKHQPPKVQTLLTLNIREGDTEATLKSTHGFKRGSVVKFSENGKTSYRTIYNLSGKTVYFIEPFDRGFSSSAPTYIEPLEFEVTAVTPDKREVFKDLSIAPASDNYFERVINQNSRLINAFNLKSDSPLPDNYPVEFEGLLSGGADGLFNVSPDDFIGMSLSPEERYGLAALETIDEIDVLACPDLMWCMKNSSNFTSLKDVEVVQHALIDHCEKIKNRVVLLDFPDQSDPVSALQWRLLFDSSYGAFYFPWVVVDSKNGAREVIPPSGFVAGLISRCDEVYGVHKAPANEIMEGVVDISAVIKDEDIGYMNAEGINCIRSFPARGIRVWGTRTTSSEQQLRFLNVRRVISSIIRALEANMQWVVFEPNSPRLWKSITRNITFFLNELYKKGFFKGGTPEEAFFVKCDEETNPPEGRDAGQLIVEIGVSPVRPAEFIVFRLREQMEEAGVGSEV